jgi:hypothetical protein
MCLQITAGKATAVPNFSEKLWKADRMEQCPLEQLVPKQKLSRDHISTLETRRVAT